MWAWLSWVFTQSLKNLQSRASWAAFSCGSLTELLSASKLIVMVAAAFLSLLLEECAPLPTGCQYPQFLATDRRYRPFTRWLLPQGQQESLIAQVEAYIR